MSVLIEIFRMVLIGSVILFAVGWVAYFFVLLRQVFGMLFARADLRAAALDPKLRFLRRLLIRVWLSALVTGLLLVALTLFREKFS